MRKRIFSFHSINFNERISQDRTFYISNSLGCHSVTYRCTLFYKVYFLFLMTVGFFNTTIFSDYQKRGTGSVSGEERVLFQQCYSGETTLMNNLILCIQKCHTLKDNIKYQTLLLRSNLTLDVYIQNLTCLQRDTGSSLTHSHSFILKDNMNLSENMTL